MRRKTDEPPEIPEDLIAAFQRAPNYPRDLAGTIALCQGLRRAGDLYHVPLSEIMGECLRMSTYCPTDADMLSVTRGIAESRETRRGGVPSYRRPAKCSLCGDTGWMCYTTQGGYDAAMRCKNGCAVPPAKGWMVTPEKLR